MNLRFLMIVLSVIWYRRRLVVAGVVCMFVAAMCVIATILGMMWSFDSISRVHPYSTLPLRLSTWNQ